ncbi:MAG: DinB family protein [Anaerolineae bacterium]|nr:maleylpyruvate isomerase N-terminal domain-containing protein [Anaerolineae bacterium]
MSIEDIHEEVNKANMKRRIVNGWNDMQAFLNTLSEEQLTTPTDAAGWTAKDHVIHMAMWEDGIVALLQGKSRTAAMGIDAATWEQDTDEINAVIQKRNRDRSLSDVRAAFQRSHDSMLATLESLKDEDLMRPYSDFDTESINSQPIFASIVGNTFGHYAEHKPWIAAIVVS